MDLPTALGAMSLGPVFQLPGAQPGPQTYLPAATITSPPIFSMPSAAAPSFIMPGAATPAFIMPGMPTSFIMPGVHTPSTMVYTPQPQVIQRVPKPLSQQKPITLIEGQLTEYPYIVQVLQVVRYCFIVWETGVGKTYVSGKLSQDTGLPMLIVCPSMLEPRWWDFINEYNLDVVGVISYNAIAGTVHSQPKSGLIYREKRSPPPESKKKKPINVFNLTPYARALINAGVLIVFDEAHALRSGTSARFDACRELIKFAMKPDNPSSGTRILYLTATPVEKDEHVFNIMRLMGIVTEKKFSTAAEEGTRMLGGQQIVEAAKSLDPVKVTAIMNEYGGEYALSYMVTSRLKEMCRKIFRQVIYGEFYSSLKIPLKIDVANYFIYLDAGTLNVMEKGFKLLAGVAEAIEAPAGLGVEAKKKIGQDITEGLQYIHFGLAIGMSRIAMEILMANPNAKIVIFTDYIQPLHKLVERLQAMRPLVLSGEETDKYVRDAKVKMFQQLDTMYRLLCGTTRTGGVGIDLDDKSGNFPRLMLLMANYSLTNILQALGRIRRMSTKSIPQARICYPINYRHAKLDELLERIAKKGDFLKDFTTDPRKGKKKKVAEEEDEPEMEEEPMKYPRHYPSVFEERPPQDGYHYPPSIYTTA